MFTYGGKTSKKLDAVFSSIHDALTEKQQMKVRGHHYRDPEIALQCLLQVCSNKRVQALVTKARAELMFLTPVQPAHAAAGQHGSADSSVVYMSQWASSRGYNPSPWSPRNGNNLRTEGAKAKFASGTGGGQARIGAPLGEVLSPADLAEERARNNRAALRGARITPRSDK